MKVNAQLLVFFLTVCVTVLCSANLFCCKHSNAKSDPLLRGYYPLEPLPINTSNEDSAKTHNASILKKLPNEAMRLSILQTDANGTMVTPVFKATAKNTKYTMTWDYMKYTTCVITKSKQNTVIKSIIPGDTENKDIENTVGYIGIIGVGLRMSASFYLLEDGVDISSPTGLALAASQKKVVGSIEIRTLGVSGLKITPLLPVPTEINQTTIQNALMAMGSAKALLYESDVDQLSLQPQFIGMVVLTPCKEEKILQDLNRIMMLMSNFNIWERELISDKTERNETSSDSTDTLNNGGIEIMKPPSTPNELENMDDTPNKPAFPGLEKNPVEPNGVTKKHL